VSRLRVACIGTGFIAGRHLAALSGFPDVEVVAVADAQPARAQDVAGRYAARAYSDSAALLESEELDAVWLCVPPSAHGPLELAAAGRGLPFFVEKPLGVDLPTAVTVAAAVRERALLTCVGYHWRSLDVVQSARQALDGARVELLSATWLDSTPAAPWWSQRSGSGGQLVEQTTHLVDLARLLVGEIATVQALEVTTAREAWPHADVPTASAVLLRFAAGGVGTITSSCVLDRRHDVGLRLVTAGRSIELTERALSDHELRIAARDGEHVVRSLQDPIAVEDRAFLDALQDGHRRVPVPYDEALRTHAAVCAADLSARQDGAVVDVPAFTAAQVAAQPTASSGGPGG
jgi:predicted dehydrogenase